MEGLAWLIMKIAVLLAITGASFFALGWWLRGRQAFSSSERIDSPASAPVTRPELVEKIEFLRSSQRTLEEERDAARRELSVVREQLTAATGELAALKDKPSVVSAPINEGFVLASTPCAPAKTAKAKPQRKPRAKKTKN